MNSLSSYSILTQEGRRQQRRKTKHLKELSETKRRLYLVRWKQLALSLLARILLSSFHLTKHKRLFFLSPERRILKMNKSFRIHNNYVKYYISYRAIFGSITATILFGQLEVRFGNHENGFYKFLEPCDHSLYREGDSWTEEIGFSQEEFYTAFEKIGIRYKSLTEYENAEGDKFQGKYYLSYYSRREGLTYYLRNHALVDELINKMNNDGFVETKKDGLCTPGQPGLQRTSRPDTVNRAPRSPFIHENTSDNTLHENTSDLKNFADANASAKVVEVEVVSSSPISKDRTTKERPRDELWDKVQALTRINIQTYNPARFAKELAVLRKAGATPLDVDQFETWWYSMDWRGQKGQPPTLPQILECWGRAFSTPVNQQPAINVPPPPYNRNLEFLKQYAAKLEKERHDDNPTQG